METFPAFNYRNLITMDREKVLDTVVQFSLMTRSMMHKYPEEWKQVDELFKMVEENREKADSRQESKEAKCVLCVSDEDYARFEKALKTKAIVKNQFDGDKFVTKIKKVDGKMVAFEPAYPLGRDVWTMTKLTTGMGEHDFNPTSYKFALRRCHGYKKFDGSDVDRVFFGIINSLPDQFSPIIDMKLRVACLSGLIAQKYDMQLLTSCRDAFVMSCPKDTNKEHVREMIVLLSALY